jgi:hypothetical protein
MRAVVAIIILVAASTTSAQSMFTSSFWKNRTGYFVLSSFTTNGSLNGISNANVKCLDDLKLHEWKGKSNAILTPDRVRAFLCDGSSCQNLYPNTTYVFARASDNSKGGDSFRTNSSGQGPGDQNAWNTTSKFGTAVGAGIWTGRGSGSQSYWSNSNSATGNYCVNWTNGMNQNRAYVGFPDRTDAQRWYTTHDTCSSSYYLICVVHPSPPSPPSTPTPTPTPTSTPIYYEPQPIEPVPM